MASSGFDGTHLGVGEDEASGVGGGAAAACGGCNPKREVVQPEVHGDGARGEKGSGGRGTTTRSRQNKGCMQFEWLRTRIR